MKEPVKVVRLPTEDKTSISIDPTGHYHYESITNDYGGYKYTYITVSQDKEPITDSCWVIATKKDLSRELLWFVRTVDGVSSFSENFAMEYVFVQNEDDIVSFSKIIATDDPKLKTGVCGNCTQGKCYDQVLECESKIPQLQQSFLKEFVVNPDGEWEVEYYADWDNLQYNEFGEYAPYKLKINPDNTVNITAVEEKERGITITNVEEKMYSKEHVEILIRHSFVKGMEISEIQQPWSKSEIFLKGWIKENLS
jgi:hypothetical protein|tara:strand:+ start:1073 stop:1831 length:759 start_codon:yes stop_codon:yes gene_type:complete